ncbi:MAG TPA: hypothetical protein ENK18_02200 [Deltaproteobacteria bacterium]|nr:hypothetical protein [Deltaproteobacteria bacterium]
MVPGAAVIQQATVANADVFRALWRAHLARGQAEQDVRIIATAASLLEALDRLGPSQIVAARISLAGQEWGAWIDLERSLLLGAAQPAEVYLAGTL